MNNITWHNSKITQTERQKNMGQKGMTLWFTGLSGSGKSTIAADLEKKLVNDGFCTYLLDGDNLRHGINENLGFSSEDRDENIRRISHITALMADSGLITIVSAISPMENMRQSTKKICGINGVFAEIYVKTSIDECIKRDPKGLYKKAKNGEIQNFTGISSPYEEPKNPTITLDTELFSVEKCVEKVYNYVKMMQKMDKITQNCIEIALKANEIIMEIYKQDFEVEYKEDKSPLTLADNSANDYICSHLKELYPEIAILSEEMADDISRLDNDFCFIIDPLDGTKEFVKKNGEFTVNIGLSFCNNVIMGVVTVPAEQKLFYAAVGEGSFFKENADKNNYSLFDPNDRIHVSENREKVVVMQSRSHPSQKLIKLLEDNKNKISNIISLGSSLKGCAIAQGLADVYYRLGPINEWDICAMQCIVECAGGIFEQLDGELLHYNKPDTLFEKGFYILNNIENKFKEN